MSGGMFLLKHLFFSNLCHGLQKQTVLLSRPAKSVQNQPEFMFILFFCIPCMVKGRGVLLEFEKNQNNIWDNKMAKAMKMIIDPCVWPEANNTAGFHSRCLLCHNSRNTPQHCNSRAKVNFLDEPVVFFLLEPCTLAQLLSKKMNEGAAIFFHTLS